MGLGKQRTKLGEWIDLKGITQQEFMRLCGVDKNTATSLCNDQEYKPSRNIRGRVIWGLHKAGYNVYEDDYWK